MSLFSSSSEAQELSLITITPPGLRPAAARFRKFTKSISVSCPITHWIHTTSNLSELGAEGSKSCKPRFKNLHLEDSTPTKSGEAFTKRSDTSTQVTLPLKLGRSKSRATRPIPAPQSQADTRLSSGRFAFKRRINSEEPATSESLMCAKPPKTPSIVVGQFDSSSQYVSPFEYQENVDGDRGDDDDDDKTPTAFHIALGVS